MPLAQRSSIQQGGSTRNCAGRQADALTEIGFDGYAVGGLAGEGHEAMCACLDYAPGQLPEDKPRYLMGAASRTTLSRPCGADRHVRLRADSVRPDRAGLHR